MIIAGDEIMKHKRSQKDNVFARRQVKFFFYFSHLQLDLLHALNEEF